jgi:hypothetical protein
MTLANQFAQFVRLAAQKILVVVYFDDQPASAVPLQAKRDQFRSVMFLNAEIAVFSGPLFEL